MGWWHDLSINLANLVAGFMGGVVNAFVFKRSEPWAIVGSVLVGAITANYLGAMAAKAFSSLPLLGGTTEPVAAFLVGMMGMGFVQGLIEVLNRKLKLNGTSGGTSREGGPK